MVCHLLHLLDVSQLFRADLDLEMATLVLIRVVEVTAASTSLARYFHLLVRALVGLVVGVVTHLLADVLHETSRFILAARRQVGLIFDFRAVLFLLTTKRRFEHLVCLGNFLDVGSR